MSASGTSVVPVIRPIPELPKQYALERRRRDQCSYDKPDPKEVEMPDTPAFSNPAPDWQAMTVSAQHRLGCWSRAWMEASQGINSALMAHAQIASSMASKGYDDWARFAAAGNPANGGAKIALRAAGHDYVASAMSRYNLAVQQMRTANDDLAKALFTAAETWAEGLDELPQPAFGFRAMPQVTGGADAAR